MIEQITRHPFPALLTLLDLCAVGWYMWARSWGFAVYWFAAALITVAATWLRGWGG